VITFHTRRRDDPPHRRGLNTPPLLQIKSISHFNFFSLLIGIIIVRNNIQLESETWQVGSEEKLLQYTCDRGLEPDTGRREESGQQ
jgi:hypothetical protein